MHSPLVFIRITDYMSAITGCGVTAYLTRKWVLIQFDIRGGRSQAAFGAAQLPFTIINILPHLHSSTLPQCIKVNPLDTLQKMPLALYNHQHSWLSAIPQHLGLYLHENLNQWEARPQSGTMSWH